ncbi:MAG: hypothetical protein Q9208_004132 [Pyrenodesmia sp. 3 TL-2023]
MAATAVKRLLSSNNNGSAPNAVADPNIFTVLPNEIHLEIAENLPLSSRLAFSLTCRSARELFLRYGQLSVIRAFAHLVPGTFGMNINSPSSSLPFSNELRELAIQRQLFLSYVERDELARMMFARRKNRNIVGNLFGAASRRARHRSIWCSHCWAYHPAEMFTEGMLKAWRHERKCIGAEGRMWICPHRQLDFQSTQRFTCRVGVSCDDNVHFSRVNVNGVTISLPVMVFSEGWYHDRSPNKGPSYGELKALVKQRNLSICPHLKMSDRSVYATATAIKNVRTGLADRALGKAETSMLKSLRKIEKKLERVSQDESLEWRGVRGCRECDTSWEFVMGDLDITLKVYRPFIHTHRIDDPGWYRQVALPSDFDELEREWLADADKYEQNPPAWPGDRPVPLRGNDQGFMHGGVLSRSQ